MLTDIELIARGYATPEILRKHGLTEKLAQRLREELGLSREVRARPSGGRGRGRPRITGRRR